MKMTCSEAVEKLVDYLHGELETADNNKVNEHIDNCKKCCGKYEFEEKFTETIRNRICTEKTPVNLRSKVMGLLKKTM